MNVSRCAFRRADSCAELVPWLRDQLPEGRFRNILVKPNWVKHEERAEFPITALVTSTDLILAAVRACAEKYRDAESIVVADVPLQSCDWDLLSRQAGLARITEAFAAVRKPVVSLLDLRRERFISQGGYLVKDRDFRGGDPHGYREVVLDHQSFLDPVSGSSNRFRVSDYDPDETLSSHRSGYHRYLIAGSVLDADLVVNMPKMKTHQKAGITGALKNLVGTVGQKAHLAHHRTGSPQRGGDEFGPDASPLVKAQVRVREALQKRSRVLFGAGKAAWGTIKRAAGIQTVGTPDNLERNMYVGSGSWYGNDTIWRMIYDLNNIVRHAPREGGELSGAVQREYVTILDGIISGEGNGPLQPIPVHTGIVGVSNDPFLLDMAMAHLMGFNPGRIPSLGNFSLFRDPDWARFDPGVAPIELDGKELRGLGELPILHRFLAPPGWKGRMEAAP